MERSTGLTELGSPVDESGRPRRRWLQFRLRTLLIAVLVLSLPLSWFAVRMERARRQRDVLYACNAVKGSEALEVTLTGVPKNSFWCTVLGDDFFDRVTCLTLVGDRIDDSALESLKLEDMSGLATLALGNANVTGTSALPPAGTSLRPRRSSNLSPFCQTRQAHCTV